VLTRSLVDGVRRLVRLREHQNAIAIPGCEVLLADNRGLRIPVDGQLEPNLAAAVGDHVVARHLWSALVGVELLQVLDLDRLRPANRRTGCRPTRRESSSRRAGSGIGPAAD
jgi:hypothetical protein